MVCDLVLGILDNLLRKAYAKLDKLLAYIKEQITISVYNTNPLARVCHYFLFLLMVTSGNEQRWVCVCPLVP